MSFHRTFSYSQSKLLRRPHPLCVVLSPVCKTLSYVYSYSNVTEVTGVKVWLSGVLSSSSILLF